MKHHSLIRLFKLTRPYLLIIVMSAICALLVNLAQLIKPYILKVVIDDFLINNIPQSGWYSTSSMGVLYLLIVLVSSCLNFAQVNMMNYAGQQIIGNLRKKVFNHIQHLPLSLLDKFSSGRLITRATNDIEALNEMFTDIIINLFKDIFLIIGIVFVMFRLNIKLALISFTVVPMIFLITNYFKFRIKKNFVTMKSLIGRINGFFAENLSGMKLVQIFRREHEKQREFQQLNDNYYKSTMVQVTLNSILRPIIEIFETLAIVMLIWYSMKNIIDNTLEIGVLYAFITYIRQFFNPINDLAEKYNTIQSSVVSADRIFELLDQNDSIEDLDRGKQIDKFVGEIEFKNVWFAYDDKGEWVLRDVSFKIDKGETVAFVGATGAGKTTIINLLSRFYEIQRGEILIDGINIKDICLRDLRKNIGVVLQDVFLFAGSIKKNIVLNSDISEEDFEDSLALSSAKEFIEELPNGIDEVVKERGATFSAGQRQLVSFARAIAHNPSIFVLDEATSNIDTKTELLIQKSIENISKEKTTLIIAHRLSTIRDADKIIILSNGQVVEIGDHNQLIERGKHYKKLYEAQFA